jgi:putative ABC transport system permease protein
MTLLKNVKAAVQVVLALPRRTVLLALPVAVSTALALATLAIDRGLAEEAEAAARSFGLDVISIRSGTRVIAGQSATVPSLTEEDVTVLRAQLPTVRGVEGTRIEDNVPMSRSGRSGSYRIFAVRPPWAGIRQFGAERGMFLDDIDVQSSARVAIVGQTVARELFGSDDPVGEEILVNQVPFRVKGVLVEKGASPAEGDRDARIVIPITTFYDRLYRRLYLDQIVVQADDSNPQTLAALEERIKSILRDRHGIAAGESDDFVVRLPDLIAEQSRGISRSVILLILGLAVVSALVAAAAIGLVFTQAVRARRAEMGVRRAIGATATDILFQIWVEGLIVSFAGGAAGLLLGWTATTRLAEWRSLAFTFDAVVIAIPVALALISSLAGLIPARMAAKLDPALALRVTA